MTVFKESKPAPALQDAGLKVPPAFFQGTGQGNEGADCMGHVMVSLLGVKPDHCVFCDLIKKTNTGIFKVKPMPVLEEHILFPMSSR